MKGPYRPLGRQGVVLITLALCALVNLAFVQNGIRTRRAWDGGFPDPLGAAESTTPGDPAPRRWQPPTKGDRQQGAGYGVGQSGHQALAEADFGSGDPAAAPKGLSALQIRRVMECHNQAIGGCLVKHAQTQVKIQLKISSSGQLSEVKTNLVGLAEQCIRRALRSVRFPRSRARLTRGSYELKVK